MSKYTVRSLLGSSLTRIYSRGQAGQRGRTLRSSTIDFDRLLRLRLIVARIGEMDLAHWWNTQGVLGPRGSQFFRRAFPITHSFAQPASRSPSLDLAALRSSTRHQVSRFGIYRQRPKTSSMTTGRLGSTMLMPGYPSSNASPRPQLPICSLPAQTWSFARPARSSSVTRLHRVAEGQSVPLPVAASTNDETRQRLSSHCPHHSGVREGWLRY